MSSDHPLAIVMRIGVGGKTTTRRTTKTKGGGGGGVRQEGEEDMSRHSIDPRRTPFIPSHNNNNNKINISLPNQHCLSAEDEQMSSSDQHTPAFGLVVVVMVVVVS